MYYEFHQIRTKGGMGMPTIELAGKMYDVDKEGFLVKPDQWNEEFAKAHANSEGIPGELTDEHWKLIRYCRDYSQKFGIVPTLRNVSKDNGVSMKRLYELFPKGPAKWACKLAGLSKPTGCV
jgi:TusE/DsrC/DsvC family sulfur relay protein